MVALNAKKTWSPPKPSTKPKEPNNYFNALLKIWIAVFNFYLIVKLIVMMVESEWFMLLLLPWLPSFIARTT